MIDEYYVIQSLNSPATYNNTGYTSEATALFAQMSVQPDPTRKGVIDACIVSLKSSGVWTKCDRIYVLAAHDAQAARLNWKSPIADALTAVSAPTFTIDRGYQGNGTSSYVRNTDLLSAMSLYAQNDAHIAGWCLTSGQDNAPSIGVMSGLDNFIQFRDGSDNLSTRIGTDVQHFGRNGITDAKGFVVGTRTSAADQYSFKNGTQLGTDPGAVGSAPPAERMSAGAVNTGAQGFAVQQFAFMSWGASINSEQSAYYTALLAYMQAVGAA